MYHSLCFTHVTPKTSTRARRFCCSETVAPLSNGVCLSHSSLGEHGFSADAPTLSITGGVSHEGGNVGGGVVPRVAGCHPGSDWEVTAYPMRARALSDVHLAADLFPFSPARLSRTYTHSWVLPLRGGAAAADPESRNETRKNGGDTAQSKVYPPHSGSVGVAAVTSFTHSTGAAKGFCFGHNHRESTRAVPSDERGGCAFSPCQSFFEDQQRSLNDSMGDRLDPDCSNLERHITTTLSPETTHPFRCAQVPHTAL